ncbi:FtsW/RodA/SpoVE family cell cycle protein [Cohnella abietis]|uniref:Cell division protein FtsW n=1 Tax=Cohnella abietis TaxID=2507935 RepID=A0A3T1D7X7_9BACL|nr:FtsW/RodA/SpoVE family cell cycle protein [Cohnella abietis]BBI34173.1 cell division protein FtsW [Cohnella abietis]
MKSVKEQALVHRFLDTVCRQIRARELHMEIKEELTAHLEEQVDNHIANGVPEKEALELAIANMGEPKRIGKGLNKAHRPRTDWVMLLLIVLLSAGGILAMYSINSSESNPMNAANLFEQKIALTVIGFVVMGLLWALDYRKIKKYSEILFALGIGFLMFGPSESNTMNGTSAWIPMGPLTLHIPTVAILLLMIGMAGIKPSRTWSWQVSLFQHIYRGLLPLILLAKMNTLIFGAVYLAIFIIQMWMIRRSLLQLTILGTGSLVLIGIFAARAKERMMGFLWPWNDPHGAGYMLLRARDAMQAGGWWGQGLGATNRTLPFIYNEGMFPYFIYCFGWIAGIAVLIIIFSFIWKAMVTTSGLKEDYGKRLSAAIGTLFAIQFIWSVMMIFGYAPFVGLTLPFLSYGGTSVVFPYALIGILLGIYRRRDMIPTGWSTKPI